MYRLHMLTFAKVGRIDPAAFIEAKILFCYYLVEEIVVATLFLCCYENGRCKQYLFEEQPVKKLLKLIKNDISSY